MALLNTVGCPLAGEVMTLHGAREPTALAGPYNIDGGNFGKHFNRYQIARLEVAGCAPDFANKTLRLASRLWKGFNASGSAGL